MKQLIFALSLISTSLMMAMKEESIRTEPTGPAASSSPLSTAGRPVPVTPAPTAATTVSAAAARPATATTATTTASRPTRFVSEAEMVQTERRDPQSLLSILPADIYKLIEKSVTPRQLATAYDLRREFRDPLSRIHALGHPSALGRPILPIILRMLESYPESYPLGDGRLIMRYLNNEGAGDIESYTIVRAGLEGTSLGELRGMTNLDICSKLRSSLLQQYWQRGSNRNEWFICTLWGDQHVPRDQYERKFNEFKAQFDAAKDAAKEKHSH